MKPFYTKATSNYDNSISIRYDELSSLYRHWHFHDEYELVFIHKSSGIRYVGDNITPFKPGDLVLLGSRLPHIWLNDSEYNEDGGDKIAATTVIHFQKRFVHNGFMELPSMEQIKNLFLKSQRGICFPLFKNIEPVLQELQSAENAQRVILILKLLLDLAEYSNKEYLASESYIKIQNTHKHDRLILVHEYIAKNFRNKISLNELADIAHMTPQAFCNFFKKKTAKTIFTYINDLKIGYSCRLLMSTDLNIAQIANESGFNSTTFFNRKFKDRMEFTPKEYRKQFKSI